MLNRKLLILLNAISLSLAASLLAAAAPPERTIHQSGMMAYAERWGSVVELNGQLYATQHGGKQGSALLRLDLAENRWTVLADPLVDKRHHYGLLVAGDGKVYLGGRQTTAAGREPLLGEIDVWKAPDKVRFLPVAKALREAGFNECVGLQNILSIGDKVWFGLSVTRPDKPNNVYSGPFVEYDPATNAIRRLPPLPESKWAHFIRSWPRRPVTDGRSIYDTHEVSYKRKEHALFRFDAVDRNWFHQILPAFEKRVGNVRSYMDGQGRWWGRTEFGLILDTGQGFQEIPWPTGYQSECNSPAFLDDQAVLTFASRGITGTTAPILYLLNEKRWILGPAIKKNRDLVGSWGWLFPSSGGVWYLNNSLRWFSTKDMLAAARSAAPEDNLTAYFEAPWKTLTIADLDLRHLARTHTLRRMGAAIVTAADAPLYDATRKKILKQLHFGECVLIRDKLEKADALFDPQTVMKNRIKQLNQPAKLRQLNEWEPAVYLNRQREITRGWMRGADLEPQRLSGIAQKPANSHITVYLSPREDSAQQYRAPSLPWGHISRILEIAPKNAGADAEPELWTTSSIDWHLGGKGFDDTKLNGWTRLNYLDVSFFPLQKETARQWSEDPRKPIAPGEKLLKWMAQEYANETIMFEPFAIDMAPPPFPVNAGEYALYSLGLIYVSRGYLGGASRLLRKITNPQLKQYLDQMINNARKPWF